MKRLYLISLVVLILDRVTKIAVDSWMNVRQTIPIIKEVFHITYVRNPGAAFGMLAGRKLFFVIVAVAVAVLILIFARQIAKSKLLGASFGLLLGGVVGNLIDRLSHVNGEVIDFLDFRFWPVFNIADTALVVGVGLYALDIFLEWKRERREA